jgi:carbamate kinase
MLIVVALGGNALLRRGQPADAQTQRENVEVAAEALSELALEHSLVITHGNGPQIGLLALQADAYTGTAPYPLDVLGAESEGMVGYLLEQALRGRMPERQTATLLTQVLVDPADPAFAHPSKPIGPMYDYATAQRLASGRGWSVAADGEGWRRVVPSPAPREIVELQTIRTLVDAGVLVVCAGGGGIPVIASASGALHGVQGVIDKDHSAALLARELHADALLLLTDVPCVQRDYGSDHAEALSDVLVAELDPQAFAEGSMRPKVQAACSFASETGHVAAIGALADAAQILGGNRGTRIHPNPPIAETEAAVRRLVDRTERLGEQERLLVRLARRAQRPVFGWRASREKAESGPRA